MKPPNFFLKKCLSITKKRFQHILCAHTRMMMIDAKCPIIRPRSASDVPPMCLKITSSL